MNSVFLKYIFFDRTTKLILLRAYNLLTFTAEDQVLRLADQKEGRADEAARWPEDRTRVFKGSKSDWWCCIKAIKDQSSQKVHCQGIHCYAPKAKGESKKAIPGKEYSIQAYACSLSPPTKSLLGLTTFWLSIVGECVISMPE